MEEDDEQLYDYTFESVQEYMIGNETGFGKYLEFTMWTNEHVGEGDKVLYKGKVYLVVNDRDVTDDDEREEGSSYTKYELELIGDNE